ncbi:App1 family protein [Polluticoccus soli]|uniref:App1 family protein n=1 Tax=Polluticoccus soli TaxID=3034150 RepID=UPI0023E25F23|nr:phosphatase domain-containing protein [Flavipsychrobacter sp. JY13-12]
MDTATKKRFKHLLNWLRINTDPIVKVYHGYGDDDAMLLYGHVFTTSPIPRKRYRNLIFSNTMALLRLFMAKPFAGAKVRVNWRGHITEAVTDTDGFFKLEWHTPTPAEKGWHPVRVDLISDVHEGVYGEGKMLIPHATQYAFISDVDDTFLVSHSSKMGKRLYVLFTKNARTRRPFEGVVRHYQLLAASNSGDGVTNPFFYVSSSEWNLYEYLKEFCRNNELPEGVFLLSQLKQWHELLKTGQTKHQGKFMRIARLLKEFPHQKFVLLGDDTQQDPYIYHSIVEAFPNQVLCVYLRHIRKSRKPAVESIIDDIRKHKVDVCYFEHSNEAILHSQKVGLIKDLVITKGEPED